MAKNGIFISLEGPEACGKSTQSKRLAARLNDEGHEVVCVREPGGTPVCELVRKILQHDLANEDIHPESELLLFAASRAQLVRSVIRPALNRGDYVISDRFLDSTVAYQGYGRCFDMKQLRAINNVAVGETVPDVTLLLDISVKDGQARLAKRNSESNASADRFEREELSFHERVRSGYLEQAALYPERIKIINADADMDTVTEEIWSHVFACRGRAL